MIGKWCTVHGGVDGLSGMVIVRWFVEIYEIYYGLPLRWTY